MNCRPQLCFIYFKLSVYKTFLAEHIFSDVTKASAKLVKGQKKLKQMYSVES